MTLLGDFDPEHPAGHPRRGAVEEPDHRPEHDAEPADRKGHEQRHPLRDGERQILGRELAEEHLDDGGDDERQRQRDRWSRLHSGGREEPEHRSYEGVADRRLGQEPHDQAGGSDPELDARTASLTRDRVRPVRLAPGGPSLGPSFQRPAPHGDEGELGRDEQSVGGDERGDQCQRPVRVQCASPSVWRAAYPEAIAP
jgi:hypothetical protein